MRKNIHKTSFSISFSLENSFFFFLHETFKKNIYIELKIVVNHQNVGKSHYDISM